MNNMHFSYRFNNANKFLLALLLFIYPLAYTYAACCAGHGGVASCNQSKGVQMCKDGTASPTCKCTKAKAKEKAQAQKKSKTLKKMTPATTATSVNKKSMTHTQSTVSKPVKRASTSNQSARGCCSKHGGVNQCNQSTGYLMCKDGSQSVSCACH